MLAVDVRRRRQPGHAGAGSTTASTRARSYDALVILLDTPGGLDELDAQDRPGRARREGAGRRLRLAERRASRERRRLDRAGGRRARDGAGRRTSARRRRSPATAQNIGSDLKRKVVNDAAASLRALARSHGRNATWADRAVRKASNLTADEALTHERHRPGRARPAGAAARRSTAGRPTPRSVTLHTAGDAVVDRGDRASSRACSTR